MGNMEISSFAKLGTTTELLFFQNKKTKMYIWREVEKDRQRFGH
jgi:hypothetical protein